MHLQVKNIFKNNFYHTFKQTCNRIEREEEHHENNELTNPFPPPSVSPSLPFCSLWVYCLLSSRFGKLPKLFPLNPLYNLQRQALIESSLHQVVSEPYVFGFEKWLLIFDPKTQKDQRIFLNLSLKNKHLSMSDDEDARIIQSKTRSYKVYPRCQVQRVEKTHQWFIISTNINPIGFTTNNGRIQCYQEKVNPHHGDFATKTFRTGDEGCQHYKTHKLNEISLVLMVIICIKL